MKPIFDALNNEGDLYRTPDSRFDLYRTPSGEWLAADADEGRLHRGTRAECEAWCGRRAAKEANTATRGTHV